MIKWPEEARNTCPIHSGEDVENYAWECVHCAARYAHNKCRSRCIQAELDGRVSVGEIEKIVLNEVLNKPIAGDLDRAKAIYANEKVCKNIAQAIFTRLYGDGEGEK